MIVMELLAEAERLDRWIARHGTGRALVRSVARFLRHMHDQGVTHVDLSPRNLLVTPAGDGFSVCLLDCEDARFRRRVTPGLRLADLHHLDERLLSAVSLRDRLRFLREYAGPQYPTWRKALGRMIRASRSKYVQAYRDLIRSRNGPIPSPNGTGATCH